MVISTVSHQTPLGDLWSSWTAQGLYRLSWKQPPATAQANSSQIVQLDELLQEYFATGRANFHRIDVDPEGWTEFSRRIYSSC